MPITQCQCNACRANRGESSPYRHYSSFTYVCERQTDISPMTATQATIQANYTSPIQITSTPSCDFVYDMLRERLEQDIPISYTEERFGSCFKKKEEPNVKRVNGVNIIEINFSYRLNL